MCFLRFVNGIYDGLRNFDYFYSKYMFESNAFANAF